MKYPQLPLFAFLSALLVLIPLPWHWRAHNVAICALVFWLFVVDVSYGVNAIVWAGNVRVVVPVWCDITTKLSVGASYALPLCTLCICKHLELVASARKVRIDGAGTRRRMIFESIVCFLVPILFMVVHYTVQDHRFDVIENIGCQPALYVSLLSILLVSFPQLLFSATTLVYALLALHHFLRRRLTFAAHLQPHGLTPHRFLGLIAMCVVQTAWGAVLASVSIWHTVVRGLRPYTSWAAVHSGFSRVDVFAQREIPEHDYALMLLSWWAVPAAGFIFFAFYGFGEEARQAYAHAWAKITGVKSQPIREDKGDVGDRSTTAPRRSFHLNAHVASSPLPPKFKSRETDAESVSTVSCYYSAPPPTRPTTTDISVSDSFPASRAPSPFPVSPLTPASTAYSHGDLDALPPTPSSFASSASAVSRAPASPLSGAFVYAGPQSFPASPASFASTAYSHGDLDALPPTPSSFASSASADSNVPASPMSGAFVHAGADALGYGHGSTPCASVASYCYAAALPPARPFSPPSVCPVGAGARAAGWPDAMYRVSVTVHRQRSVDWVV